jgi:hypothetical protein
LIELVVLLIASVGLFMMMVGGVLMAFDFIAAAFSPAFDDFQLTGGGPGIPND